MLFLGSGVVAESRAVFFFGSGVVAESRGRVRFLHQHDLMMYYYEVSRGPRMIYYADMSRGSGGIFLS